MKNANICNRDIEKFRERIERLRGDTPQQDFCKGIDVSVRTYQNWISGKYTGYNNKFSYTLPDIETAIKICDKYNISLDYLFGRCDFVGVGNKEISDITGLSDTAIECLRSWNKDKTWLKDYSNDIDTINTILEYYGKQRKKATKNGGFPNFSIFHFIGNYLNAHKFKRVQQDDIIFRSGKGKNSHLEKGDTVIKKDTGKTVEVKEIYPPVNSRSNRGYDTSQIDLVNTENENEMYYMPVSNIYREYAKSQIQKQLDKIGGFD